MKGDFYGKKKSDKIITHRIELQQHERKLAEDLTTAFMVNRISTPLVNLISDVSAMTFLIGVYLSYKYGDEVLEQLADSYDDMGSLMNDAYKITKTAIPVIGSVSIFGFDIGNIIDAFIPGNIYGADRGIF